jgi:hypothetical protein
MQYIHNDILECYFLCVHSLRSAGIAVDAV